MGLNQARIKQNKLLSAHILAKGKAMMKKLIPFEKTQNPRVTQLAFYRNRLQQQQLKEQTLRLEQHDFYNYEHVFTASQASQGIPKTQSSPSSSSPKPEDNPALAKLITKVKLGQKMLAEASINDSEFFLALGLSKRVVKELILEMSQRKLI